MIINDKITCLPKVWSLKALQQAQTAHETSRNSRVAAVCGVAFPRQGPNPRPETSCSSSRPDSWEARSHSNTPGARELCFLAAYFMLTKRGQAQSLPESARRRFACRVLLLYLLHVRSIIEHWCTKDRGETQSKQELHGPGQARRRPPTCQKKGLIQRRFCKAMAQLLGNPRRVTRIDTKHW